NGFMECPDLARSGAPPLNGVAPVGAGRDGLQQPVHGPATPPIVAKNAEQLLGQNGIVRWRKAPVAPSTASWRIALVRRAWRPEGGRPKRAFPLGALDGPRREAEACPRLSDRGAAVGSRRLLRFESGKPTTCSAAKRYG